MSDNAAPSTPRASRAELAPNSKLSNFPEATDRPRWLAPVAIIAGLLGFLCFVALPFLPVNQTQSSLHWPQGESLNSVNAPLISYAPDSMSATVPLSSIEDLRADESLIFGTVPEDSDDAFERGLFVNSYSGGLTISARGEVIVDLHDDEVADYGPAAAVSLNVTDGGTTATIDGEKVGASDDDGRPMLTGIYSELTDDASTASALAGEGFSVDVEINSRFTSAPTVLKYTAMFAGLGFMAVSLFALWRMDRLDGRGRIPLLNKGALRPRFIDGVVAGLLGLWHIFGGNTSDDGYLLTMARASQESGYMANYYRWFGVPESPFGSPFYDLLAQMTHISTASAWMRLPALISGLIIWFVLSRMVLPRLGEAIGSRQLSQWTAALVFLAFWFPYNNGTRPEPIIAMGVLVTWVCFERALATKRLFPAAIGVAMATLSLGAGPTGLMAVAALLAALAPLIIVLYRRLPLLGAGPGSSKATTTVAALAMLAPFLATGTAILIAVFGDQTLATVLESTRVRSEIGPALSWYDELSRYQSLLSTDSVDGSVTRRLPVFMMFASLIIVTAVMLRNRQVRHAATDVVTRLSLTIVGTLVFMTFTPTKWTHHFGVFAGMAPALAAVAAVALSTLVMRSAWLRTFSLGSFLMIFALALVGNNGWWYVSSFSIPWWDKDIQIEGIRSSSVVLLVAVVVLLIAAVQFFINSVRTVEASDAGTLGDYTEKRRRINAQALLTRFAAAPISLICAFAVMLSLGSFAKAFADQYPAYSVGLGNVRNLTGDTCQLANDAMMETNTNDSFLTTADGTEFGDSLETGGARGFDPNGIPETISEEHESSASSGAIADSVQGDSSSGSDSDQDAAAGSSGNSNTSGQSGQGRDAAGNNSNANNRNNESGAEGSNSQNTSGNTGGEREQEGINGSNQVLPFNLDFTRIPVLGSYAKNPEGKAEALTSWYNLPQQRSEDAPLVVVSIAGRTNFTDINGVKEEDNQDIVLEYGHQGDNGRVTNTGSVVMDDIDAEPTWRNLRYPLEQLPEDANVVRVRATDESLDPEQWLAFTPPRVPTLASLNDVIEDDAPGLLDWPAAFQYPCQRPFDHVAGVAENPQFRVSPEYPGKMTLSPVQNYQGGGAMGPAEAVNYYYELPGYLKDDWARDWGSVEIYVPRTNSEDVAPDDAVIDHEQMVRSGLWSPGEMNFDTKNRY